MIKTNVFETTKQVKQNAEGLLNKIKVLNGDIDTHLNTVNTLWNVLEKQQASVKLDIIRNLEIEGAHELQADEQSPKIEHEPPILKKSSLVEAKSIHEANLQINTAKQDDTTFVQRRPRTESNAPVEHRPRTESSAPVEHRPRTQSSAPVQHRPRTESSAPVEHRPKPSFKPDTGNVPGTVRKPMQGDKFPNQGAGQRQPIANARPPYRGRNDKKPGDIVDKFFADPELKEREKKEKEEAGKGIVQRTNPAVAKVKNRQDKKELWGSKESDKISLLNKHRTGKDKMSGRFAVNEPKPIVERKKSITMGDFITVKNLSEKIGVQAAEIIKRLIKLGMLVTINQELDYDTAMLVSGEFNIELEKKIVKSYEQVMSDDDVVDSFDMLEERPPIVTVMGHVDHGKTSLLDAIRNSRVTDKEAGGITQHIGAYTIDVNNKSITFLDTPGHEAFTSMRVRGAQVTDMAILVVAADDGIMPQTIEAINHAKAAKVPIIVAINKIDKPGTDPERVRQQLMEHGLVDEKWGGDTITVPVSAVKRQGIDKLLEIIILVAEIQELKANPGRLAKGTIIEAQLDKGRGPVATVLVQNGTLKVGDAIVAGTKYGRVRAMMDYKGNRVKKAGPSMPVEVLGLTELPEAGDILHVVKDDKLAKQVAEEREAKLREIQTKTSSKTSLEELFSQVKEEGSKELNLIIKADVQGSVEAVKNALERIPNEKIKIKAIHGGVGAITESDIMLATASNAIIIGFNVRPSAAAAELAEKEQVDIRLYRIIYNAIEDIQAAMKGMLDPVFKEVLVGHAAIRAVFKVTGMGNVAGCYITDGKIVRNAGVRLIRDGIIVYDGKISSLKRFKDDAKEVSVGYECGVTLSNYTDIKEGDTLEAFVQEEVKN